MIRIQKNNIGTAPFRASALALLLCVCGSSAFLGAEDEPQERPLSINREGWRLGLDLGVGNIDYDLFGQSNRGEKFYMALNAGYAVTPRLRIGVESSGWLLEPGNLNYYGSSSGEGISQLIMLTGHVYPIDNSHLYLKMGLGVSSYWNDPLGYRESDAGTWSLGIGNDFFFNDQSGWSPHVSFSSGDTGVGDYNAVTIAVSFFWNQR